MLMMMRKLLATTLMTLLLAAPLAGAAPTVTTETSGDCKRYVITQDDGTKVYGPWGPDVGKPLDTECPGSVYNGPLGPIGTTSDDACGVPATLVLLGPLYVEVRDDRESTLSFWIYYESNDREGLQRGGSGPAGAIPALATTDGCQDAESPDTLLF